MSYFVHRAGTTTDPFTGESRARAGWTGPISEDDQAGREAEAWRACGWTATIHPNTPEVRAQVFAWQLRVIQSWRDSTDASQRARYWHYIETGTDEALTGLRPEDDD